MLEGVAMEHLGSSTAWARVRWAFSRSGRGSATSMGVGGFVMMWKTSRAHGPASGDIATGEDAGEGSPYQSVFLDGRTVEVAGKNGEGVCGNSVG